MAHVVTRRGLLLTAGTVFTAGTAFVLHNSTSQVQAVQSDEERINTAALSWKDFSREVVYPVPSSVFNVKDFGAVGDGSTDDTVAIQNALIAARGTMTGKVVYFPNGTYLVSNRLVMTEDAILHRTMDIQGQSTWKTIIKLADNTPAFGDAAAPLAVLSSFHGTPPLRTWQNSAFATSIMNLTIDVGTGNPGAVGLSYVANNQSTVRDVIITSSDPEHRGHAGLDMALETIPGPFLVKNVLIDGFKYGMTGKHGQYSMVFENILMRNQTEAAIYNQAGTLTLRKVFSLNSVPAIQQVAGGETKGMIIIIDSFLLGKRAFSHTAIDIQDGFYFARNVNTLGYGTAINDHGQLTKRFFISESKHGETASLFPSPQKSLNLPIHETPEVPWDDPATWADVTTFGAVPDGSVDSTDAIQKAMDSGATTIYFPNITTGSGTHYLVQKTITVGNNVRRIVGMTSEIRVDGELKAGGAVFKFVDGLQPVIEMQGLRLSNQPGYYWFIEQASSKTLVLKNLLIRRGYLYRNTGFGDVYLEDVHNLPSRITDPGPSFIFKNQRVWARQLNPEFGSPEIINDGATLWILGFKSELGTTMIETINGGKTEVLGGLTINSNPTNATVPAFINNESSVSIVHNEYRSNGTRGIFTTVVQETRNGETKTLLNTDLPSRKAGTDDSQSYVIPLYTGYSAS